MNFEYKKVDNNEVIPKKVSWLHVAVVCFMLGMCIWLLVLLLLGNVKEDALICIDLLIRVAGMLLGLISLSAYLIKLQFNIYSRCTWLSLSWPEIVLGFIVSAVFIFRGITFFIMIANIIR